MVSVKNLFGATRGIPSRLGVCKPCFARLRNQTVSDYYGGLEPELGPTWQHNSVFLGNLEYQILPTEVQQYVHDLLFGGTGLNHYLFTVKCRRGGPWAHHWAHAKVFKRFAFVTCTFARDVARLLVMGANTTLWLKGRRLVIRPCLIRGSWLYLYGNKTWVRTDVAANNHDCLDVGETPPTTTLLATWGTKGDVPT